MTSSHKRFSILSGMLVIAAFALALIYETNGWTTRPEPVQMSSEQEIQRIRTNVRRTEIESVSLEKTRLVSTMIEHGCTRGNFCELYATKKGVALKVWNDRYFAEGPLVFEFQLNNSVIQSKVQEYECTYEDTCIAIICTGYEEQRGEAIYVPIRLVRRTLRELVYFRIS
jgi:hypothetical protein